MSARCSLHHIHDCLWWWRFTRLPSLWFHCLADSLANIHKDAEPSALVAETGGLAGCLIGYIKQISTNTVSYRELFVFFDQMRCCEKKEFKFVPCSTYLMFFLLFSERFKTDIWRSHMDVFENGLRSMWCADYGNGTTLRTLLSRLAQRFFFGADNDDVTRDFFLTEIARFCGILMTTIRTALYNIFVTYELMPFATIRGIAKHWASVYPFAVNYI